MKSVFRIICLFLATVAFGQAPRPYVTGGLGLMPAGYASTAFQGTAGFEWNPKYAVFDGYVGYDNGRKDNDNTAFNYKGRDRFVRAFIGPKLGLWYIGVGARYSQLSTSNYSKGGSPFDAGSWHPEVGLGRDFSTRSTPLFMRLQALYMARPSKEVTHYPSGVSCDGCGNGSHGLDVTLWFPSPEHSGHFFAKMNIVLFRFHTTVTEPDNIPLTIQQESQRFTGDSTEFMAGVRW